MNIIAGIIIFSSLLFLYVPASKGEEPSWSIALSKFNSKKDAQTEVTKLKNSGHNAFFRKEKESDNDKTVYQVYIEKYTSRDEAEAEAMVLKDLDLISDYTVKDIKETPPPVKPEETPPGKNDPETSPFAVPAVIDNQGTEPSTGKIETQQAGPEPEPMEQIPEDKNPPVSNAPPAGKTDFEKKDPEPSPETQEQPIKVPKPTEVKKSGPEKQVIHSKPEKSRKHEPSAESSLQVGAFKEEANAAALEIKLKNMGKNAIYRKEMTDSKEVFYRLYITGYNSLGEAVKDAKKLLKKGVISGYSRVHSKDIPSNTLKKKAVKNKKPGKIYFIHVGSNKDEANAAETVDKLNKMGYKAIYLYETDPSGNWYKVYIGKFKDEAEARKKGMELYEKKIISYFKPIGMDSQNLEN